jgi:quinol monooxygenase YgiN
MAYIYHIDFSIRPEQMDQLQIGAALERVLGYLRTLLPSETGYITARAMYSLDGEDRTELVFQSVWETWEDLEAHKASELAEDKVLTEFEPHVELQDLAVQVYEEIA